MQKTTKQQNTQTSHISYNNSEKLVKKDILGVEITDETKDNILEFLVKSLQKSSKPYYIVTPNPEMIVLASKNPAFRRILNNAKIASNDGIGIGLAAKIFGIPLHERFTGVELMKKVCERLADWPITVGFLGGRPSVAELTAECLAKQYPGLKVAFANSEEDKLLKLPKSLMPMVLFVAFGAPRQEFWMADKVGKIPVKVMLGVGGAFDYISGKVPRAPQIVQSVGMEWLFRLIVQPWRIKRQLALLEFVLMVVKTKLKFT